MRSAILGVLAAVCAGSGANGANLTAADITNPSSQFFNPTNNHIYEFVRGGGAWTNALSAASASSLSGYMGYLATITSSDEQDFVYASALQFSPQVSSPSAYWLGGSDYGVEGEWTWYSGPESGQQFWLGDATGYSLGGAYQHWDFNSSPPQPNTDENSATEDYLELMINMPWNNLTMGFWGDENLAGNENGYVIEYGTSPVPEPATWALMILGFGLVGNSMRRRGRRVVSNPI